MKIQRALFVTKEEHSLLKLAVKALVAKLESSKTPEPEKLKAANMMLMHITEVDPS